MYDYHRKLDYYNYDNNNYNKPMFSENESPKTVLDPFNGFIRGNMFPNLYNTYKINAPFEIEPLNEQADMLTNIDAFCFALIDLNLYLDVYPNDRDMIELYNKYRKQKDELVKMYENKYGPLTLNSESLNRYPWAWLGMSPWENGR